MFSFMKYIKEISTIAQTQHVDIDMAFDKFRADVNAGKALPYNTGDSIPDFKFAPVLKKWERLTDIEKQAAFEEWNKYLMENFSGR